MKLLSHNLIHLVLVTVLSISPIQTIAASISDCFDSNQTMHHAAKAEHHQLAKSENQHDCCETTACDMTHCAGFVAITVNADTQNGMIYTLSEVYANPVESLFNFYPSSLYRPPKA